MRRLRDEPTTAVAVSDACRPRLAPLAMDSRANAVGDVDAVFLFRLSAELAALTVLVTCELLDIIALQSTCSTAKE